VGTESPGRRATRTGQVARVISGSDGELLAWSEALPVNRRVAPGTTVPRRLAEGSRASSSSTCKVDRRPAWVSWHGRAR
jgi:hypothetical protein